MPPNNAPTVSHMEHALGNTPKRLDVILLGELNVRLQEPRDARKVELAMVVAECGLEDTKAHFMKRSRYRGDGNWTWRIIRENQQMTGQGDYVLGTSIHNFFSAGVREAWIHIDHQMVLAVI